MVGKAITVECFLHGVGQEHLREGWSEVGSDTWTLGHRATAEFPPPETATDYTLTLEVSGIAGPADSAVQRIVVTVNDLRVADVLCRGAQRFEFFVPSATMAAGRTVHVAFDLPFACRPIDFGHNSDTRLLSLRVARILFEPLVPPLTGFARDKDEQLAQRDVLLDIHSLGVNCEIGFLQRSVGAEPMGLFRWTSAPLPRLLRAMENGFKGLGAPGSLNIQLDAESEFIVRDTVYGFQYHSFVYANRGGTLEQVSLNEYNRLTYLSRLLLEELRAGKKLFAYHDGGHSDLEDIRRLLRAMNQYGRNTLLWIVPAPSPDEVSTARELEPGIIQAFVSGFQRPIDQVMPTSVHQPSWLAAIAAGHRIWRSQMTQESSAAADPPVFLMPVASRSS